MFGLRSLARSARRPEPHGHDSVYLTFRRAEQPGSGLGRGRWRADPASLPDLSARLDHRTWAPAQTGARRRSRLDRDPAGTVQRVWENVHVSAAILSALLPLQPDCPQPGIAQILYRALQLGIGGTHRQRSRTGGRCLHATPMVSKSGLLAAAVFVPAPRDRRCKRCIARRRASLPDSAAAVLANCVSLPEPVLATAAVRRK